MGTDTGALIQGHSYRGTYTGALIQGHLYRGTHTGALIPGHLYRGTHTGALIQGHLYRGGGHPWPMGESLERMAYSHKKHVLVKIVKRRHPFPRALYAPISSLVGNA